MGLEDMGSGLGGLIQSGYNWLNTLPIPIKVGVGLIVFIIGFSLFEYRAFNIEHEEKIKDKIIEESKEKFNKDD